MEPAPTQGSENLFIMCSWKTEGGQATPHPYAPELSAMLEEDFGRISQQPLVSVLVMEAQAGEFSNEVLKWLQVSWMTSA